MNQRDVQIVDEILGQMESAPEYARKGLEEDALRSVLHVCTLLAQQPSKTALAAAQAEALRMLRQLPLLKSEAKALETLLAATAQGGDGDVPPPL